MAVAGGEVTEVVAAGPTDLKRYLPLSLAVTGVVTGLPLWVAFGLGPRLGLTSMLASIALSFALAQLGNYVWQRQPGSRDVIFNDLMLWGFVRRTVSQHRRLRKIGQLGLSAGNDPDALTIEERTELIKSLAVALETGDPYTHGHSQRVARHAYMVAKSLKLPRHAAEKIRLAGIIHDIGKLRTPREIITKPGQLTDAEFATIQRHTIDGSEMVKVLGDDEITDMVRHHHERLDGTGYPDNLIGDDISIGARVLAVVDTFDAASSLRPYRSSRKHKVALDILEEDAAAGRLDPDVVHAFVRYYSGRRSLRWWSIAATSPGQLHNLPVMVAQRVGTGSLANVVVVGVTAVALTAGGAWDGGTKHERPRPKAANQAASEQQRSFAGTMFGYSSTERSTSAATGLGTSGGSAHSRRSKNEKRNKGRPEQAGQPRVPARTNQDGKAGAGSNATGEDPPLAASAEEIAPVPDDRAITKNSEVTTGSRPAPMAPSPKEPVAIGKDAAKL